jgi:hypothetical protein
MSYGENRVKKLKKIATEKYQILPYLDEIESIEYHKKGTLCNSMLEKFILEDYKLWSVELSVRFCQEHNIRTVYDCITYSGMRNMPEMYDCTWEQYIKNNKEEK